MKLAPHHEVVAVDINPVQLAYAERRFDGDPGFRGRAERIMDFMRFFGPIAGWWPSRVRAFLDLDDPTEQVDYWQRELNTWRFRTSIDALFSVTALRSVYAPRLPRFPAEATRSGHAWAHGALLRTAPQSHEPLRAFPATGRAVLRAPSHRRRRTCGSCTRTPRSFSKTRQPASFDGFTLSNILDGVDDAYQTKASSPQSNAQRHLGATTVLRELRRYADAKLATQIAPPMTEPCSGAASS